MRGRTLWQAASLAAEPRLPGDTEVAAFERLIGRLIQLQTQQPACYQTSAMLTDKIVDAIRGEWFTATVMPDSAGDAHMLAARITLMLRTGTTTHALAQPPTTATATTTTTPAFLLDTADADAEPPTDTMTVTMAADYPEDDNRVYSVLRRFRANSTTPYHTERTLARRHRSLRGPGPENPCHTCQGTDHFARQCPKMQGGSTGAPYAARYATLPPELSHDPPLETLTEPPPIPPQAAPGGNATPAWYLMSTPIRTSYAVVEADIKTAILDSGTPGDLGGNTWLARNLQAVTSAMVPATTRFALGRDVPDTIGRIGLRITTVSPAGANVIPDLSKVHVLRHAPVPLLFGLASNQRLKMVMDAAECIVTIGTARDPVHVSSQHGHITLPPAPTAPTPTPLWSMLYTGSEHSLAHRKFGHAAVTTLTAAFPPHTFTPTDVATLNTITASGIPSQTYSHLPRRPRYPLLPGPLVFNCVIAMDVFQLTAALPKVLDIMCLDTDYGEGRFVSSMRAEVMFTIANLIWFAIHGCPETMLMDRGSENENDAVMNGVTSMGIHWRAAPTEAPRSIGRIKRLDGPIRDAFLRIIAETPIHAPELALAMAYKASNDAPRAHGVAPTTAVTGEPPRLLIGDNIHADRTIPGRARAMQTARATMEKYTAADRLRGALSRPGTVVPYVKVGEDVLLHRERHGCLRGMVHSLDGNTVYVRRDGKIFSSHEVRTKPFVARTPPPRPPPTGGSTPTDAPH